MLLNEKIINHVVEFLKKHGEVEELKLMNRIYLIYNEILSQSVIISLKNRKLVSITDGKWKLNLD